MRLVAAAILLVTSGGITLADDCTSPRDTSEMKRCESARWEKADTELNAVYSHALSAARADFQLKRVVFDSMPDSEETLRAAQRAWVAFRDSNCEDYQQKEFGASMARLLYFSCMADMTSQRVKEMRALHGVSEDVGGKR